MIRHPVDDGFAVIVANVLDRWIGVLEARAGEVPVEVRVCKIEGILAAPAFAARCIFSLAEKHLGEPEREPLFSDPSRTVKQEACR